MKTALFVLLITVAASGLRAAPLDKPQSVATTLTTATGTLNGTLELPAGKGPFPVALIIAGSGPTDRDGNDTQMDLNTDSYKLLAEALAKNGIASLRYDKRGAGEDAALALFEKKPFETEISDAVAWGKQLHSDQRFSTLTIIGHSEGSLQGMLVSLNIPADGFISIAGPGEPIQKVMLRQMHSQLTTDEYQEMKNLLASLEQGKPVTGVLPPLDTIFGTSSAQSYLISWMQYDPTKEIAKLNVPVLIAQGERDLQVTVADAQALAKADPSAKLVLVPDMNHALKDVGPSRKANLAAYNDPHLPLDHTLVISISDFIQQLPP